MPSHHTHTHTSSGTDWSCGIMLPSKAQTQRDPQKVKRNIMSQRHRTWNPIWTSVTQCEPIRIQILYIYIFINICKYIYIHPQAECPAFHSPPHSRLEHRWAGHGLGQHLRHEARVVAVDAGRGHAASLVPGSAGVGCFTNRGAEIMGWSSPNQWRILYI